MGTKQLALIVTVLVLAIAAYLVLRPLGDGDSDPGQPPPTGQDGTPVPALVGPTKQGDIYVLDRRTGEPIIPVRGSPGADRRHRGGFHRADAAGLRPHLHAAALDGQGHVGRDDVRPARMPHRVPQSYATKAATRRRRCRDR